MTPPPVSAQGPDSAQGPVSAQGPDPAQVLAAVAAILTRVTARPQPGLSAETPLDMIDGADSLRLLETIALAEEQFAVAVDTGGLDSLLTVGDIVGLITRGTAP